MAFADAHAGALLVAFAVLSLVAALIASRLDLHSDFAELLPEGHPAVTAFRNISGRQKSSTNLVMLVSSTAAADNLRFITALRPRLEGLVPDTFTEIQWRPDSEQPAYARHWRWLYADKAQLENAEDLLDRLVARRNAPLVVDLEGDPEAELHALRAKLDAKLPAESHGDYFIGEGAGRHWLGVMLWRSRDGLASRGDYETLEAVKQVVREAAPAGYGHDLRVEFTGHIAQALDEQSGIREDLTIATVLCISLVLLAIYFYFRRAAILLVIGVPAFVGLLLSLAVAALTIHHLNINTAFLISIILGNGINSPIILMARYSEERGAGRGSVGAALTTALSETFVGTLVAMGAASVVYGCLLLTSFRGFNQFGLIGGCGMLLVWLVTFLIVPPLVIAGERRRPGVFTPKSRRGLLGWLSDAFWRRPFAFLGQKAERRPLLLCAAVVALVAASASPLARYARDPFEWNFDNLRTEETPSQKLWSRMDALGMGSVGAGYVGNDGVLLVDKPEQAAVVAEAMRKADQARGPDHVLFAVRTLGSTLPTEQAEKLAILARVRDKINRYSGLMNSDERKEVEAWRPPDYLRIVVEDDLPRLVREAFTETDGQRGRLVGIDSDPATFFSWDGHALLRMARSAQVDALGKHWVAASVANVFAGMIDAIVHDTPWVSLAAVCGVTLIAFVAFGLRGGLLMILALAVGLTWLGGLLAYLKLKINFMNFVALPITLGVGADYAANIWGRLRGETGASVAAVVERTGSAVALCSTTTIIGYSSLLLARNRALRSFGLVADLGEITCLTAALVLLPALVRWLRRRPEKRDVEIGMAA